MAGKNTTETSLCTVCSRVKPIEDFYKDKRRPLGIRSECKECAKAQRADWRSRNPGRDNIAAKRRRLKDPRKDRAKSRRHYTNNSESERARTRRWNEANRETYLRVSRESGRKRRSTPKGRLECAVGRAMRHALVGGSKSGRRTLELLDYTIDELMSHLESLFEAGMTWENYGEWHIDHIIPLSVHNYDTPDDIDFKKAWALSNLQPLWASDNMSKGAKLSQPFQPSLAIGHIIQRTSWEHHNKPSE